MHAHGYVAYTYCADYVIVDTANSIACSLVNTRLDYANSVLSGISRAELAKLRRVQNTLARVVLGT